MGSYRIIVTPDANANLAELCFYTSLKKLPARIAPVNEEPWHSRGIRFLIVKNFYVYYRIDEDAKKVYVLNVVYNKRDQLRVLAKMDSK